MSPADLATSPHIVFVRLMGGPLDGWTRTYHLTDPQYRQTVKRNGNVITFSGVPGGRYKVTVRRGLVWTGIWEIFDKSGEKA